MKDQVIEYRGLISAGNTAKHHLQTFPSLQQSCLVQLCLSLVFAILEYLHICSGEACCSCRYQSAWEPSMCQRRASSPDDLLFSRVKNKQNFLIFQRNKRIKEFVASLSVHWVGVSVAKGAPSPCNKMLWNKMLFAVTQCCPASSS